MKVKPKIGYIVTPFGQKGGGMARVKDFMMQSGGDRFGRVRFVAMDTRGNKNVLLSIFFVARAVFRIWFSALRKEVAFVHVNMAERGSLLRKLLIILAIRITSVPIVLHLHAAELIRLYRESDFFSQWIIRLPFRLSTCCIVLGCLWRNWLIDELGIEPEKIQIVYNGVPAEFRPKAMDLEKPFTFLFLGNLQERKGLSDFLYALAILPKEGTAWRAVIAGGGNVSQYKKIAASLKLSSRVEFMGWVNQAKVSTFLHEASALVLPSYEEGLPLVVLEALGCGTPVIATPVGSIPEVLENDRHVLLVTPGDRTGLANKMIELIQRPNLQRSLAEEGRALYEARFSVQSFIDSLFETYRRYCGIKIERKPSGSPPAQ
ncbi:MAG: glycosyltransferase family 4 protein [Alphaproteobacteria bacterium]|nr:glycosyltransferase family 4 protein [Alphaproteobacteria bacterium]